MPRKGRNGKNQRLAGNLKEVNVPAKLIYPKDIQPFFNSVLTKTKCH